MYAISPYSVVPVRNGAAHSSELISQLLFGETVEILETKGRKWHRVRCTHDNHIGWVDYNQLRAITESEFLAIQKDFSYNLELLQPAVGEGYYLPLTMGARLPDFDGLRFQLIDKYYTFSGQAVHANKIAFQPELLIKIARRYLYAPYLWGGRSPLGIDASGLTQMIFQICGKALPRDPLAQLEHGDIIDFVEQTMVGDLAFFENKVGRITHVGVLLEHQEIIHAHGCVRIDQLDHFGIYNRDTRRYTHRLRVIKRIFAYDEKVVRKDKKEDTKGNLQQINLF